MLFNELVLVFEKLSKTTKRLEMTDILSDFFKKIDCEEIGFITLLCMGKMFPKSKNIELGIANNMMIEAIALSCGMSKDYVKNKWNLYGDLGETAKNLMIKKKQTSLISKELTIKEFKEIVYKIPTITGKGSSKIKLKLISKLLSMITPSGAMYLSRILIGSMRTGVGQAVVRDALAKAFNADSKDIEKNYNLCADYSIIATKVCKNPDLIKNPKIKIFNAINMMLFLKANNITEAFEKVNKPAKIEIKYDGLRAQIHKKNEKVIIFTRNLDDITLQFPDVVKLVNEQIKADEIIFECEIVGIDKETKKPLPFQYLSKRIKRKHNILKEMKKIPVKLFCFDLLMCEGKNYLDEKLIIRDEILKNSIKENENIMLVKGIITSDEEKAKKLFTEGIKEHEGVMFKNLNSTYQAGSRVGHGVKLKSQMKELDLVITKAYYGKGRRKEWFGSYELSCYDSENDNFLTIGKLGTGFTDKILNEMNKLVKKFIIKKETDHVVLTPKIVVEVDYEEIQKSPTYSSGFALRFPRLARLRYDKLPHQASDLKLIKELKK